MMISSHSIYNRATNGTKRALSHSEWRKWGVIQGGIRGENLKSTMKLYNEYINSWILRHEFP